MPHESTAQQLLFDTIGFHPQTQKLELPCRQHNQHTDFIRDTQKIHKTALYSIKSTGKETSRIRLHYSLIRLSVTSVTKKRYALFHIDDS